MQCLEFRNIKFDTKLCQIICYFNSSLSYMHSGWIYGQMGINSDKVWYAYVAKLGLYNSIYYISICNKSINWFAIPG